MVFKNTIFKKLLFIVVLTFAISTIINHNIVTANTNPRTIYVNNDGSETSTGGDGTINSPYDNIRYALEQANENDTIVLTEDILDRAQSNEKYFTINKKVTIDGNNHALRFRGLDLQILQDVTLKNMNLYSIKDGVEKGLKIYASGYNLTLENVTTKISDLQSDIRPTLFAGAVSDVNEGPGSNIKIIGGSSETRFNNIVAGSDMVDNYNDVNITIESDFAKSDNGIILGGLKGNQSTGNITVTSNSREIKKIDGSNTVLGQKTINFKNISNTDIELNNLSNLNLNLTESASITPITNSSNIENLNIETGSQVWLNNEVTIKNVAGEGTIVVNKDATLTSNSIADTLKIKINVNENDLNKVYVTTTNPTNATASLLLPNSNYKVIKEGNNFKITNNDETAPDNNGGNNPINHTVTINYTFNNNVIKNEITEIENGGSISYQNIKDNIPTSNDVRYLIDEANFNKDILNNITETKTIVIPLKEETVTAVEFDPNTIQSIDIVTQPTKTTYNEGETLDLSGIELRLTDVNNISKTVRLEEFVKYNINVNPNNNAVLTATNTTVTLSVNSVNKEFNITINPQTNSNPNANGSDTNTTPTDNGDANPTDNTTGGTTNTEDTGNTNTAPVDNTGNDTTAPVDNGNTTKPVDNEGDNNQPDNNGTTTTNPADNSNNTNTGTTNTEGTNNTGDNTNPDVNNPTNNTGNDTTTPVDNGNTTKPVDNSGTTTTNPADNSNDTNSGTTNTGDTTNTDVNNPANNTGNDTTAPVDNGNATKPVDNSDTTTTSPTDNSNNTNTGTTNTNPVDNTGNDATKPVDNGSTNTTTNTGTVNNTGNNSNTANTGNTNNTPTSTQTNITSTSNTTTTTNITKELPKTGIIDLNGLGIVMLLTGLISLVIKKRK